MLGENREDALPCTLGRLPLIAEPADVDEGRQELVRGDVVQEAVAGVRVLLDIVSHARLTEGLLQTLGPAAQHPVAPAEASDDRTRARQPLAPVPGSLAIVDRRRLEAATRRAQQGEPSTHAEADDPDPPGAVLPRGEKSPRRLDVLVGRSASQIGRAHV